MFSEHCSIRILAALVAVPVLLVFARAEDGAASAAAPAPLHEWAFLYVMSYDNNLDVCAEVITAGLHKGVKSDQVVVAILTDRLKQHGLRRVLLRAGEEREEVALESDDITDQRVLAEYLAWARDELRARRYALVFLDHGGRLDEMCLDLHPVSAAEKSKKSARGREGWLSAAATGKTLREWSETLAATSATFDLLFLQQCGRGSIENFYNFRETARYIMASQTVVGAPNTYYTATVGHVCEVIADKDPAKISGEVVARKIMETDEHYTNYVLVDGLELASFKERSGKLATALAAKDSLATPESMLCFEVMGETNHDLLDCLRALVGTDAGDAKAELDLLREWVEKELILEHGRNKASGGPAAAWCGLSLFVPQSQTQLAEYEGLDIYKESGWGELARKLAAVAAPTAER